MRSGMRATVPLSRASSSDEATPTRMAASGSDRPAFVRAWRSARPMSGTESESPGLHRWRGLRHDRAPRTPSVRRRMTLQIVPGTPPFLAARPQAPGLRTSRLSCVSWVSCGQKKWKEVTGHTRTSTLPTMSDREIGPQYRLSQDSVRLSPIMK